MKKIYITFIKVMLFGMAFSQVPTNGLVAYYPFIGDANDKSGNSLNGTLTAAGSGLPSLSTDRFGNIDNAYSFVSTNSQFIDLGNPSQFKFGSGSSFTLSAWYNSTITTTQVIMSHGANGYALYFQPATNDYLKFSKDLIVATNFGGSNPIKPAGSWYHVAAVCNVGSSVKLYLNGQLVNATATVFGYTFSYNNNLTIGKAANGLYFNGQIDDVRIYNRGLDQSEVSALSNESNPILFTDNSTVEDATLKVYPNPTTGTINLEIKETASTVTIHDTYGRLLPGFPLTNKVGQIQINIPEKGIYNLSIKTEQGSITRKIMVD